MVTRRRRAKTPQKILSVAGSAIAVPQFENEAAERAFWERHDSVSYLDWSRAQKVRLSNLKPSTENKTT